MRQASLIQGLAQLWRCSGSIVAPSAASAGLELLQRQAAWHGSSSGIPAVRQALQLVSCRWFTAMPARQAPERDFIALNTLADNPGATHYVSGGSNAKGCTPPLGEGRRLACLCLLQLDIVHGQPVLMACFSAGRRPSGWVGASARA